MAIKEKKISKIVTLILVIFVCLCILIPFLWLVISSLSLRVNLTSIPLKWFPSKLNFKNYNEIIFGSSISSINNSLRKGILNSFIIASFATLICLFAGSLAAYVFSRLEFHGKAALFSFILTSQLMPMMVLIIPVYVIFTKMGILNTKLSLIVADCSFTLPFVIWLMKSFFESVPKELEEMARIDGCSRYGTIFKIIMPLSTPGLAASGIFSFIIAWNEFFSALVFSSTLNSKTVSVIISEFSSKVGVDYVAMASAGVVASIPPVVISIIFQKQIIHGLTAGAVKG